MQYKKFITKEEMVEKFNFLNDDEMESLLLYKNSMYEVFNFYVRYGIIPPNEYINDESVINSHIKNIISAMKKYKMYGVRLRDLDINHVFRGIGLPSFYPQIPFMQLALMSTTTDNSKTNKYLKDNPCCIFSITVNEDLLYFNFDDSEKEVLFEPYIKLVNFNEIGRSSYHCEMEKMTLSEIATTKQFNFESYSKQRDIEEELEVQLKKRRAQLIEEDDTDWSFPEDIPTDTTFSAATPAASGGSLGAGAADSNKKGKKIKYIQRSKVVRNRRSNKKRKVVRNRR